MSEMIIIKKIENIVEDFRNLSKDKQELITHILRQYVNSKIEIDNAYYLLIEKGLIPKTKFKSERIPPTLEELKLKKYIKNKISNLAK